MLQAHNEDREDDFSLSSEEGEAHSQYACVATATTNSKMAMALKSTKVQDLDLRSVWLLDNQFTFDLCCNPVFTSRQRSAKRALNMLSNGSGLCISKECKVLAYNFWVWFIKREITNIICLKNLVHLYWVTYDSEQRMAFIVHWEEYSLLNMIFYMCPFGLHLYYPKKTDGQYGFVQTVSDSMKLFNK